MSEVEDEDGGIEASAGYLSSCEEAVNILQAHKTSADHGASSSASALPPKRSRQLAREHAGDYDDFDSLGLRGGGRGNDDGGASKE